jgi:hypothetical protein
MTLNAGFLGQLSALTLALGLVGCSGAPASGGYGTVGDGSGSNGGGRSGQSSSGGGSSGGAASGSNGAGAGNGSSGRNGGGSGGSSGQPSGSGSSSGNGSSSGSASSGTGSSGSSSSGSTGTGRGCGQGTSCTPGNDLAPPAAGQGFQFVLKAGDVTIQPGAESYYCLYKTIPGNAAIDVGAFQSWMSPGSSHHFITFQSATAGQADGYIQPNCGIGTGNWVYATSVSGQIIELKMPDTVGLTLGANAQLILNMHFVNPGSTPAQPTLKLNVLLAKNVQYHASTMISFNATINIPAGGMQTVHGTCQAPVGAKFFAMTTHTHKHATATDVNYIHGGQTQNIVHTTDWQNPDVGLWNAPNFLTVQSGDSFSYSCAYTNTGPIAVTVGETAANNEMCMAIGYFFPTGTATCN